MLLQTEAILAPRTCRRCSFGPTPHTAHHVLAIRMWTEARLQAEYQQGADSVYFPHLGIIAILSPSRALPVLLAEYSRKFVGVPTLTATK
eukprot:g4003.t1